MLSQKDSHAVGSYDSSITQNCFHGNVLMAVKKDFWAGSLDIIIEGIKSQMDIVLPIMDMPGRIVSNKNVDAGKRREHGGDFLLLKKKVAFGLVLPCPGEPSENKAPRFNNIEVKIMDRRRKDARRIVVSFDCEDLSATNALSHFKNGLVGNISA